MKKVKRKINPDLRIHLIVFILNCAKLRMLKFYYDFLDYYLHCEDLDMLEMDTDNNSQDNLEDVEDLSNPN